MNAVYQGIESRDPVVSNAWFDTLIDVINILDEAQIKEKVLPFAKDKSNLSQPLYHRVASCRIFGALALYPKFSPSDVKREVLPSAQSLCQDCHPEIRSAIASQIPFVMKGLGSSPEKSVLLPCLVELANDEKVVVRAAAVSAIVGSFKYVTQETIKDIVAPLFKRLYEKNLDTTDSAIVVLAKEMGVILKIIEPYLNTQSLEWYLKTYKTMASKGKPASVRETFISQEVLCRDHCAANLPALAEITLSRIPDKFELYYATFRSLVNDPCFFIRRTVAEVFSEVAEIVGIKSNVMKSELISLLKDDVDEIVQALVMNLDLILQTLTKHRYLTKRVAEPLTFEIGGALIKCQNDLIKSNNWRLLTNFLNRLQFLPNCMPSDYIHQNFTPTILNVAISGRAKPARLEACRTLLWFLRNNAKETQKQWLRDNLITNLCYSSSFYTRQMFVKLCVDALEIFNNKYFKDFFFIPFVSLIDDKVSNIRYGVVLLLPRLRLILTPQDSVLQKLFNGAVNKIKFNEKDRDVKKTFESLKKEIEGPVSPTAIESMIKLEKKKQDMDQQTLYLRRVSDTVYQKTFLPQDAPPSGYSMKSPSGSVSKSAPMSVSTSQKSIPSQKNESKVPASPNSNTKNDMTFLEQHFYVDAGIVFPNNSSNIDAKVQDEFKEELLKEMTSISKNMNVTDDDKCIIRLKSTSPPFANDTNTLRKLSRNHDPGKRHSSFHSSECVENYKEKLEKRKSLNIICKENSKIPICYKQQKNASEERRHPENRPSELKKLSKEEFNRNSITTNIKTHKQRNSFIPVPESKNIAKPKGNFQLRGNEDRMPLLPIAK